MRIINVASAAHAFGQINFDDLMCEQSYDPWRAYGASKLANIMFTYELARRLKQDAGAKVTANCLHPGVVRTELGRWVRWPGPTPGAAAAALQAARRGRGARARGAALGLRRAGAAPEAERRRRRPPAPAPRHMVTEQNAWYMPAAIELMQRFGMISAPEGAATSIYLASSPEVEGLSGRYWVKCKKAMSKAESYDPDVAAQLWQRSRELVAA